MSKGIGFLSLLLFTIVSQAAVDNQLIQSLDASRITLAGSIGKVAMFAVQADDDDDLEIFATASSTASYQNDNWDIGNDHWIVLDRNAADTEYTIVARGELQSPGNYATGSETVSAYLSGYQVNYQKILLGHDRGLLSTIEFVNNPNATQHTIISNSRQLSSFLPQIPGFEGLADVYAINSIVSLTGTDQNEYIILCTDGPIYLYDEAQETINSSIGYSMVGKGCLTGNIDYQKVNGQFDEELIASTGYVYTFDGSNFQEKPEYYDTFDFNSNRSRLANIDDDPVHELLQQR